MIGFPKLPKEAVVDEQKVLGRLDWPVFQAGGAGRESRALHEKTGRNCLGPVPDFRDLPVFSTRPAQISLPPALMG